MYRLRLDLHIIRFHADSIGSAVPRDCFDATIQSVFNSSVNLQLDPEDRLVTIHRSDHYNLPQGIRIADPNVRLNSLAVDQNAALRGGVLRFTASPLTIDLRGASIWTGKIPVINTGFEKSWWMAWQALNEEQRLKQTELIAEDLFRTTSTSRLIRTLNQPIFRLFTAFERYDLLSGMEAASRLIGLGPGVTPSGDDVLIGFMAGLYCTAGTDQKKLVLIQAFGSALCLLAKGTNDISRTFLFHAARGEFASSLVTLVEAIQNGEERALYLTLKGSMQVGHSSGTDSVTGLLIGLAVWDAVLIKMI